MVVWHLIVIGAIIPSVAQAQVMIDMSKVTCADYLAMPPNQSRTFSAWMSGYFNASRNQPTVDLSRFAANKSRVEKYCKRRKNENLMNAIQKAAF